MARIVLQFVDADGTFLLRGLRVRAAAGAGDLPGTLYDESARGVRTPLESEDARQLILGQVNAPLHEFVRALPVVRLEAIAS